MCFMETELKKKAFNIRKRALNLIYHAQVSHSACALSCVEILTVLYEIVNRSKIRNQEYDRDRIILSKGHAIATQLSALCEYGLLDENQLLEYCRNGSAFPENTSPYTPYIDVATGSLGQGLSFGVGAALGMKMRHYDNSWVYVIVGDGELNEGQSWEAIQQAGCRELDNLIVLVDANGLAGIQETCIRGDLKQKFEAFHFETKIVEGNDVAEIMYCLRGWSEKSTPKAVICNTTKGKGISFMESNNDWHYRPISESDYHRIQDEMRNYYEE